MNNQEKHADITSGKHLLTIISRFPPMPPWQKTIVYALCVVLGCLLVFGSSYCLWKSIMPLWLGVLSIAASVAFVLMGHVIVLGSNERTNPMVVSDIGISIGPRHCATWGEIKSWRFRGYYGVERLAFGRIGEGTTICIETKDWQDRFNSNKGHSVFGLQGYFLDDIEQVIWRQICADKGVKEEK